MNLAGVFNHKVIHEMIGLTGRDESGVLLLLTGEAKGEPFLAHELCLMPWMRETFPDHAFPAEADGFDSQHFVRFPARFVESPTLTPVYASTPEACQFHAGAEEAAVFDTGFDADSGSLFPLLFYHGQAKRASSFLPRCLAPSSSEQFRGLVTQFKRKVLRTHVRTAKAGRHHLSMPSFPAGLIWGALQVGLIQVDKIAASGQMQISTPWEILTGDAAIGKGAYMDNHGYEL
jgi:hypothetical protein